MLKEQGIDSESKLTETSDAVLLSKKIDISETLLRAIRSIIRDGQLLTEFEAASNSKGARKRKELGPFNKESYVPPEKVRILKPK